MGNLQRRIGFGILWFGIFWMALLVIGGGVSGAMAGAASRPASGTTVQQSIQHNQEIGLKAGIEFRERYGRWVLIGAAVLAMAGTVAGLLPGTRRR